MVRLIQLLVRAGCVCGSGINRSEGLPFSGKESFDISVDIVSLEEGHDYFTGTFTNVTKKLPQTGNLNGELLGYAFY